MAKRPFLSSPRASLATRTLVAALVASNVLAPVRVDAFLQRPADRPPVPAVTPPPAAPVVRVNRTVPKVSPPPAEPVFSANPRNDEVRAARIFKEPLVAIGEPSAEENRALAAALRRHRADPGDETGRAITDFLARYPTSPWRPSLLANLATRLKHQGYFSRALALWDQAWLQAKGATAPEQAAVADYALGEWLELSTKFGHADAIEARLNEIEGRDVRGSAAAKVWQAREGLVCFRERHHEAVSSGAVALQVLLKSSRPSQALPAALLRYHPTPAGTTLVELRDLARSSDLPMRMIKWRPGSKVPFPAIVHLRSDHYSTVLEERDGRYLLSDPILGDGMWISRAALESEGTGYALIPESADVNAGWVNATEAEGALVIGHCAHGSPASNVPPCDVEKVKSVLCCSGGGAGGGCGAGTCKGMAGYSFHPVQAALQIFDTPVSYTPPRGPAVPFTVTYMHRDQMLPQVFAFGNIGSKWTHNWLSYVTDNPAQPNATVALYLRGAGEEHYPNPDANGVFPAYFRSKAVLVRTSANPIRYERRLPDGGLEVFSQSDGSTGVGRRIFLTEVRDAQGQGASLTYDSQFRLVAITDAIGQVTTLSYQFALDPLKISKVTDPFGRFATLAYDELRRLRSITDPIGITSTFGYEANDFIGALTTPYGTTTFRHESSGSNTVRFIEATDPLGAKERLEWRWSTTAFPATVPAAEVPAGFAAANENMDHYLSLYWGKRAMALGGQDSQALILKWLLGNEGLVGTFTHAQPVPHSRKAPLESRIWYQYEGQGAPSQSVGSSVRAITTARVLDDGATQKWQATYNALGHLTSRTDPLGRRTSYTYAPNGFALQQVRQTTGTLNDLLSAASDYTDGNLPQAIVTGSGEITTVTYNAAHQVSAVTRPTGHQRQLSYTAEGRLQSISEASLGTTTTYTYDAYGRLQSTTDSDGYPLTMEYDVLDRLTRTTYPDGSSEEIVYDRLDPVRFRDRLGRWTYATYDSARRLLTVRDAAGRTTRRTWCSCGSLDKVVDGNGNAMSWQRDVQGRVTSQLYAGVTTTFAYDGIGRLVSTIDGKSQATTYSYAADNNLLSIVFANAPVPTPSVQYSYDSAYPRVSSMSDGNGTTFYTYHPSGTLGAGYLASEDGPLPNDTISYAYDQLGRQVQRSVNGGSNVVTTVFDSLGRVVSETSLLGTFSVGYDGQTRRVATVTYPNGQTTSYTYWPHQQDRRPRTIHHKKADGSTLSRHDYVWDAVGNVTEWKQQAGESAPLVWEFAYDSADQLRRAVQRTIEPTPTIVKRLAYQYDSAGNRVFEQIDDSVTQLAYDTGGRLIAQMAGGTVRFGGTIGEPGTVVVAGRAADVSATGAFSAGVPVTSGQNVINIEAADSSGNVATATYEVAVGGAVKSFSVDANGNLVADGNRQFEWNAADQLSAIVDGTKRIAFAYDGWGRRSRVTETVGGVAQESALIWSGHSVLEERDLALVTTVWRGFRLGAQVTGTAVYETQDHLGSTWDTTDASGALLSRAVYSPWGSLELAQGTLAPRRRFGGYFASGDTDLLLAPYRGYSPSLGRFVSDDPIGLAGGWNLAAFADNNPISRVDPLGLTTGQLPPVWPPPGWEPGPQHFPPNRLPPPPGDHIIGPDGIPRGLPTRIPPPPNMPAVAGAVINGVIWGCVVVEAYCAIQTDLPYNQCVGTAFGACCQFGTVN